MKKIKLLLIDDHQLFIDGLKHSLLSFDFIEVINTFNNAQNALLYLKKESVDLVITDISMPDINGIEFIKKLKQQGSIIKVLAISMFKPLHNEANFYDGYLLKDASIEEVIGAIKSIVLDDTSYFAEGIFNENNRFEFSKSIVSKREKEIINLIAEELTVDEIAEQLFLSKHTVETHKKNIFLKLQVKTNAGLVKKALQLGIIS